MKVVQFIVMTVFSITVISCGLVESLDSQADSAIDLGFRIEVVEARFLPDSMGEKRLYAQVKLTNESEPQDLVMANHRLRVITEGAGMLSIGFHDPATPDDVELCSIYNNGRAVPKGSSEVCGFMVKSKSKFTPLRIRYEADFGGGVIVEGDFPKDIPQE